MIGGGGYNNVNFSMAEGLMDFLAVPTDLLTPMGFGWLLGGLLLFVIVWALARKIWSR